MRRADFTTPSHYPSPPGLGTPIDPIRWIQCCQCYAFHAIPAHVDEKTICIDRWACPMNTWTMPQVTCCLTTQINLQHETDETANVSHMYKTDNHAVLMELYARDQDMVRQATEGAKLSAQAETGGSSNGLGENADASPKLTTVVLR